MGKCCTRGYGFTALLCNHVALFFDRPLFPSNSIANANTEQMQQTISKFMREHPSHPVAISLAGIASGSRDSKLVSLEKVKQSMKAIGSPSINTI
jgi:hypothetical protein